MDVLAHLVVPLLCLLAARVRPGRALLVAPLAVLPDLDSFLGPHRAAAHNVFALALVAGVAYAAARGRVPDPGRFAGLAAFAYGSHLVLDLAGGVALLWPVATEALLLRPHVLVDMGGALPVFLPQITWRILPHAPQFADAPLGLGPAPPVHVMVGAEAVAIAALLVIALLLERPWRRAGLAAG